MKEALLYKKLKDKKVRCLVCQRNCLISPNQVGFCHTRFNQDGILYTLIYGILSGPPQLDDIEKKPLYHFHPGTKVLSIGTFGCNFRCRQCQNWWCSWGDPSSTILKGLKEKSVFTNFQVQKATPEEIVNLAIKVGSPGIAYTYNEPVIWLEFVLDCAKLARKKGLFNVCVTNGSWTREWLDLAGPYIDAANIDFKGFSPKTYAKQGAFWGKLLENAVYAQKKHKILLELTTLLIPSINDDPKELKKMAQWIQKKLGPNTPWHLSRFSPSSAPDPKFKEIPPTSKETLNQAYKIGKKQGLNFVYVWAPGIDFDGGVYAKGDTYCPKCKLKVLKRHFWEPETIKINKKGRCKKCGQNLNFKL